jgi:replicative DNA helicase
MADRIPPYSEEAEKGALGAMLLDPMRLIMVARNELKIKPEDFYTPAHQKICQAMFTLMEKDKWVDVLILGEALKLAGQLDAVGGSAALDRLIDATPTEAHGEYYLDIVRQKSILRREISLAREIESEAYEVERGDEHVATVPGRFTAIVSEVTTEVSNAQIMANRMGKWRAANKLLARKEGREPTTAMGLPTPWDEFTRMLCGVDIGLNIICARPSEGKTTLAGELALHWLQLGIAGAVLEMDITTDRFLQRCAHRKAGVSLAKTKQGFSSERQLDDLQKAHEEIGKYPLYMNDWDRDIGASVSWIRAQKMRHGIEWAVIDHMTCMTNSKMGTQWNNHMLYGDICHQLKSLALKLKLPIVLLWQLTKANAKENRNPVLSDLRETGSGEEDASTVTALYRDLKVVKEMEKNMPGSTKNRRPTYVEVLKNQDGETGRLPFWFLGSYFQFEECDGFDKLTAGGFDKLTAGGFDEGPGSGEDPETGPDEQEFEGISGGNE